MGPVSGNILTARRRKLVPGDPLTEIPDLTSVSSVGVGVAGSHAVPFVL